MKISSQEIQSTIANWAGTWGFDAPYGILTGASTSKSGKPYKSVTFGRRRTLDVEVQIYNQNFIVVRTNRHGNMSFNSYTEAQKFLDTL